MDKRRLTGLVALIILVGVLAILTYFDWRTTAPEAPIAFAPAQSSDESIPVGDTPIEPPVALTEVPAADRAPETVVAAVPPVVLPAPPTTQTAPEAAPTPEVAVVPPVMPPQQAVPPVAAPDVAAAPPVTQPEPAVPPTAPPEVAAAPPPAPPEPAAPPAAPEIAAVPPAPPAESVTPPATAPEVVAAPEIAAVEAPPTGPVANSRPAPADVPGVAVAEPEPPAASAPEATVVPTFDVVRVEPSGETVVAGLAEPGATVEVLDGPVAVATAEANARGEWALALDEPLPPGAHDLALRTTSKDRRITLLSDQRVAVSVPDDKSKDVLVVLNTPDAASTVLQMPGPAAPAPAQDVAGAPPAEMPVAEPGPPAEVEVAAKEPAPAMEAPAASPSAVAEPEVAEPEVAMAPAAEARTAPPPAQAEVQTVRPPAQAEVAVAPGAGPAASPSAAAEPEVAIALPPVAKPVTPLAQAEVAVAPVAEPPTPAAPVVQPAVTVAAVEADTAGALFVAGTAETGESVRVYLDNQPIGEATPTPSGTWLVEARRELPAGTYQVRADQLDEATGVVIARAEVPFEREIEVVTLKPVATVAETGGAQLSGQAPELKTIIIKRGDNLWRIAREVYGRGIRYSTIYQANRDQIRNPRWIYPGQVFIVPVGATNRPN